MSQPIVLFVKAGAGLRYRIKALQDVGFDVRLTDSFGAKSLAEELKHDDEKVSLVVVDLNKPLADLHQDELIDGKHPLVHTYKEIVEVIGELPTIFISNANVGLAAFGVLEGHSTCFLCSGETDAVGFAGYARNFLQQHPPPPTSA